MNRLLFALAVCLVFSASARHMVDAQQPAAPAPQPAAPAQKPATPAPQVTAPAAPPAGYAGSDTCALCHEDRATDVARTRHGQVRDVRTPAATLGCESCHGPGQAHVDDDAKGHIKRFGALNRPR